MSDLTWKKFHPLTDKNAFICLVDSMGDDSSIVRAARVSYGKDEQSSQCKSIAICKDGYTCQEDKKTYTCTDCKTVYDWEWNKLYESKDRQLIRYLMNHGHSTPCEMVEFVFMVQVPMDCWRQWVRHRTASINEYSTRYTEALDFFQVTDPSEWRLQATDNKQGSSGYLEEWGPNDGIPKGGNHVVPDIGSKAWPTFIKMYPTPGAYLSKIEQGVHLRNQNVYKVRLEFGVAKEQARKDLPLSTYTRAYWKCDLHNIFNFLRLRMDSHAQLEIRQFANSMFEIIKQVCPVACEAFEDYILHAKKFSRMEMELIKRGMGNCEDNGDTVFVKPDSMTNREWKEFMEKLS